MNESTGIVEKLRACPFCGGSDFLKVDDYQFPPDSEGPAWKWGYHVVCSAAGFDNQQRGCGCSSAWGETPDEAIESWNRRAQSPGVLPAVKGLLEIQDTIRGYDTATSSQSDVLDEVDRIASRALSALSALPASQPEVEGGDA